MTDKEFRRLRRIELIEIIYKLQNNEERLRRELEEVQRKLADKELKLEKAGSIAEASVALNNVMEAAQAAADQYLQQIERMHAEEQAAHEDAMARAEQIVREAYEKQAAILAQAQSQREDILEQARQETEHEVQADDGKPAEHDALHPVTEEIQEGRQNNEP